MNPKIEESQVIKEDLSNLKKTLRLVASGEQHQPGTIKGDGEIDYNERMNSPVTHYELDAKMESIESRMDARIARIEDTLANINNQLTHVLNDNKETRNGFSSLKDSFSSLKTTMIVTGISTALAIILGVAAFNATLLSNMLASYESGKNTATAIEKSTAVIERTSEELRSLREQIGRPEKK